MLLRVEVRDLAGVMRHDLTAGCRGAVVNSHNPVEESRALLSTPATMPALPTRIRDGSDGRRFGVARRSNIDRGPCIDRPSLGLSWATFGEHAPAMPIPEDDCVVCKSWRLADRWARRRITEWLPLGDDQPVCEECMMISWQRLIVSDEARA
jgi:hypothetical protein